MPRFPAGAPTRRDRGRFIVFEGGEGSGKSTQAARLASDLGAVLTREPGGTTIGERIRALALDPASGDLDPRAEALLMAAARAHHVATVIRPALESGRDVVCDRFAGSSIAYQGYGRGLPVEDVATISTWATAGLQPDRVILLEVDRDLAAGRRSRRASDPGEKGDRIEDEPPDFHARVEAGFRDLAAANRQTWRIVDGSGTPDEVAERVRVAVDGLDAD